MGKDDYDGGGGGELFDQFIPREIRKGHEHDHDVLCANIDVLGQQQDHQQYRAFRQQQQQQEMGGGGPSSTMASTPLHQLPTPDFNVDEQVQSGGGGGGGYWNGSDTLSSMSMSDFLPENWPPPADNELMLRLLWDGYAMSFDDSALHVGRSA